MKYTGEQLRKQLWTLPESEQDYLLSEEVAEKIRKISDTQKLSPEQMGKLASTVGLVLLKLLKPTEFAHELAVELDIPPSKAAAVAGDVEKEIFQNISRPPSSVESPPFLRRSAASETSGEVVESKHHPVPPEGGTPLLNRGGDRKSAEPSPRPVPLRKDIPPRPSSVQTPPPPPKPPTPPTLQTLLADIKRGTAYDENRIAESYRKTPVEVRQALESVGFLSRLQEISKKFGLNVEETGEFVSESGLVMIGLTKPMEFVDHIVNRLRVPRDRALAIGQAANMEIFRPVREILRKMNQPAPSPNLPTGTQNFSENISRPKSPLEGSTPPLGGGRDVIKQYTHDPYREPI